MTADGHHPMAHNGAGNQRQQHIQQHRQQQGFPRHDNIADAEQHRRNRREREDHDDVVDRYLHQCVVRITLGQLRPDKYHRRARRHAQQDHAGNVFAGALRIDQIGKQHTEEHIAQQCHGERLDQPVDHQRQPDALRLFADFLDGGEIDLNHHREDHCPDQHRHHQIDVGVFNAGNYCEHIRQQQAEADTGSNAQAHPDGQIALK